MAREHRGRHANPEAPDQVPQMRAPAPGTPAGEGWPGDAGDLAPGRPVPSGSPTGAGYPAPGQPGDMAYPPPGAPDVTGRPPAGRAVDAPVDVAPGGEKHKVRRSRFGGIWVGLIVAALLLVLALVFVLQNSQSVQIEFFGWSGQAPLAVAILLGLAAGALLVAIPGSVRILQLRKTAKRD